MYLRADGESADDLAQELFQTLFESDQPFRPSLVQLRGYMAGVDAVVLVDDLEVDRQSLDQLLDACVDCSFVVARHRPAPGWRGNVVHVGGLTPEQLTSLAGRRLGRPLTSAERAAVDAVARETDGHPLRFLQLVTEADGRLRMTTSTPTPAPTLPVSLSSRQESLLGLLAALRGDPVPLETVAGCSGIEPAHAEESLEALRQRGLVVYEPAAGRKPTGYRVARDALSQVARQVDVGAAAQRLTAFYSEWATAASPDAILSHGSTLRSVLGIATEHQQWSTVSDLAARIEPVLGRQGRLAAWGDGLERGRHAAKMGGDLSTEARFLHQLGIRALCRQDPESARHLLGEALGLRSALGDTQAAGLSRYHLEFAEELDPPRARTPIRPPWPHTGLGGPGVASLAAMGAPAAVSKRARWPWLRGLPWTNYAVGAALLLVLAGGPVALASKGPLGTPADATDTEEERDTQIPDRPVRPAEDGTPGAVGRAGTDGTRGVDGTSGVDGAGGVVGPASAPGSPGTPGTTGAPGPAGTHGVPGSPGPRGPAGPSPEESCRFAVDHPWTEACVDASGRVGPVDGLPPSDRRR